MKGWKNPCLHFNRLTGSVSVGVCNVFQPVVKCDEMHHYLSRDFFSFFPLNSLLIKVSGLYVWVGYLFYFIHFFLALCLKSMCNVGWHRYSLLQDAQTLIKFEVDAIDVKLVFGLLCHSIFSCTQISQKTRCFRQQNDLKL